MASRVRARGGWMMGNRAGAVGRTGEGEFALWCGSSSTGGARGSIARDCAYVGGIARAGSLQRLAHHGMVAPFATSIGVLASMSLPRIFILMPTLYASCEGL